MIQCKASVALMGLLMFVAVGAAQDQSAPTKWQLKEKKKVKEPKPPSQAAITYECITVYDIYSHGLSLLSGIAAPQPGLAAKIQNNCAMTVSVFLTIGYFDSRGVQFGDGMTNSTVAAGTRFDLYHEAGLVGMDRGLLKQARVIKVDAFPAR